MKLKPRDVCRLALDERLSNREVGRVAGVSATTVGKYRALMKINGMGRAELDLTSNEALTELLQARYRGGAKTFIEPDWDAVYQSYQKRDVTVALLYQEYVEASEGLAGGALRSESSFGRRLREHCKDRGLSMRQEHLPGQENYVDFSGKHLYLTNPTTGEKRPVEIFVSSLGNSRLLFCTAVASQRKADWVEANVRAVEYYGGATVMTIPDNLKSAVVKTGGKGRDPVINRSYLDFADHYGTVIVPARPVRPQDKALAEISVRIVNMWVIAALRNHVFHSLDQINALIGPIIDRINAKKTRRLGGFSRRELFQEYEAAHLKPLPATRHLFTEWYESIRVQRDYHIQYHRDYYSVPHQLVGRLVSFCVTRSTIRIFGEQSTQPVASHALGPGNGSTITNREHMPDAHRIYAGQNVEELLAWADNVGQGVRQLFDAVMSNPRIHPVSAIRQMSKAQKLAKEYGHDRLASSCARAVHVGTPTIESVASILKLEIDLRPADGIRPAAVPVAHNNVRGSAAYSGDK